MVGTSNQSVPEIAIDNPHDHQFSPWFIGPTGPYPTGIPTHLPITKGHRNKALTWPGVFSPNIAWPRNERRMGMDGNGWEWMGWLPKMSGWTHQNRIGGDRDGDQWSRNITKLPYESLWIHMLWIWYEYDSWMKLLIVQIPWSWLIAKIKMSRSALSH